MWSGSDGLRFIPQPGARSFHWLGAARCAVVVSGNVLGNLSHVDELCARITAPSTEAALDQFFAELQEDDRKLQGNWAYTGQGTTPQVVAVGGPAGKPPRLGRLR